MGGSSSRLASEPAHWSWSRAVVCGMVCEVAEIKVRLFSMLTVDVLWLYHNAHALLAEVERLRALAEERGGE
jgi:hypothetical protein